jgi:hypothetical protein
LPPPLAACSDPTAPTPAISPHGVVLFATVPGTCLVGGCDPVSSEATHLGLGTVRNTAPTTAFLQQCGTGPALSEQQFLNGQSVNVGPAISCAFAPGPITIAAGDSLRLNWSLGTGRRPAGARCRDAVVDVG